MKRQVQSYATIINPFWTGNKWTENFTLNKSACRTAENISSRISSISERLASENLEEMFPCYCHYLVSHEQMNV